MPSQRFYNEIDEIVNWSIAIISGTLGGLYDGIRLDEQAVELSYLTWDASIILGHHSPRIVGQAFPLETPRNPNPDIEQLKQHFSSEMEFKSHYDISSRRMAERAATFKSLQQYWKQANGAERMYLVTRIGVSSFVQGAILKHIPVLHHFWKTNKQHFGRYTEPPQFKIIESLLTKTNKVRPSSSVPVVTIDDLRQCVNPQEFSFVYYKNAMGKHEFLITPTTEVMHKYVKYTERVNGKVVSKEMPILIAPEHARLARSRPVYAAGQMMIENGTIATSKALEYGPMATDVMVQAHASLKLMIDNCRPRTVGDLTKRSAESMQTRLQHLFRGLDSRLADYTAQYGVPFEVNSLLRKSIIEEMTACYKVPTLLSDAVKAPFKLREVKHQFRRMGIKNEAYMAQRMHEINVKNWLDDRLPSLLQLNALFSKTYREPARMNNASAYLTQGRHLQALLTHALQQFGFKSEEIVGKFNVRQLAMDPYISNKIPAWTSLLNAGQAPSSPLLVLLALLQPLSATRQDMELTLDYSRAERRYAWLRLTLDIARDYMHSEKYPAITKSAIAALEYDVDSARSDLRCHEKIRGGSETGFWSRLLPFASLAAADKGPYELFVPENHSNSSPKIDKKPAEKFVRIVVNERATTVAKRTSGAVMGDVLEATVEIHTGVQREVKSFPLKDLNHQTKTWFTAIHPSDKVEIVFTNSNATITLPKKMNGNLIQFLKQYKPIENVSYCCANFALEMTFGRMPSPKYEFKFASANERKLNIGDIIYLHPSKYSHAFKGPFHFAIYIGHKKYLSLFDMNGPLTVATRTQLESIYKTKFNPQLMTSMKPYDKKNVSSDWVQPTNTPAEAPAISPIASLLPTFIFNPLFAGTLKKEHSTTIPSVPQTPLPKPKSALKDYPWAMIKGAAIGVYNGIRIDKTVVSAAKFLWDTGVMLGSQPGMFDDPELREWMTRLNQLPDSLYANSTQRMQQRAGLVKQMGVQFQKANGPERVQMATELLVGAYLQGVAFKGIANIPRAVKAKANFGSFTQPPLFAKMEASSKRPSIGEAPPPIELMDMSAVRAYPDGEPLIFALVQEGQGYKTLIARSNIEKLHTVIERAPNGQPYKTLRLGYYITCEQLAAWRPVYAAGEITLTNGRLSTLRGHDLGKMPKPWSSIDGLDLPLSSQINPATLNPGVIAELHCRNLGAPEAVIQRAVAEANLFSRQMGLPIHSIKPQASHGKSNSLQRLRDNQGKVKSDWTHMYSLPTEIIEKIVNPPHTLRGAITNNSGYQTQGAHLGPLIEQAMIKFGFSAKEVKGQFTSGPLEICNILPAEVASLPLSKLQTALTAAFSPKTLQSAVDPDSDNHYFTALMATRKDTSTRYQEHRHAFEVMDKRPFVTGSHSSKTQLGTGPSMVQGSHHASSTPERKVGKRSPAGDWLWSRLPFSSAAAAADKTSNARFIPESVKLEMYKHYPRFVLDPVEIVRQYPQAVATAAPAKSDGSRKLLNIVMDDLKHPIDHLIAPALRGVALGADDLHHMITHPIATLYQIGLFNWDALVLISAAHNNGDRDAHVFRAAALKEGSLYSNSRRRMHERWSHIDALGKAFSQANPHEQLTMAMRLITAIYVPGTVIKTAQGLHHLGKVGQFNPAVYNERRLPILTNLRNIKADFRSHFRDWLDTSAHGLCHTSVEFWSTIDQIRSTSMKMAQECEYAYVILPCGKFRAISAELGGHGNLTSGHWKSASGKSIFIGGDLVAQNGRIIKIDNRSGDYSPYLEREVLTHVFKGLGVPEVNIPGVIQETYTRAECLEAGVRRSKAIKFSRPHPAAVLSTHLFHTNESYMDMLEACVLALPKPSLMSMAYGASKHPETDKNCMAPPIQKGQSAQELGAQKRYKEAPPKDFRKFSPADQIHLYKCIRHDNPLPPILMSTSVLKFAESTTMFIYVVDQNGVITMGPEQIYDADGKLQVQHHDQLIQSASSDCVVLAGTIQVINDTSSNSRKYFVDNGSGHFEPRGPHQEAIAKRVFTQIGIEINFRYAHGDSPIDYANPPENLILISPTTAQTASSRVEAPSTPPKSTSFAIPLPLSSIFQQLQADSEMSQQLPNTEQGQLSKGNPSSPDKSESMNDSGAELARQEEAFEEVEQNLFDSCMPFRPGVFGKLQEKLEKINPLATFPKRLEEDKKNYPNVSEDEHRTAALAQTFVEEGLKKGATVGGGALGFKFGRKEGAAIGAFVAHNLAKPVAEAAGRVANTAIHNTYAALQHPQKAQTSHKERTRTTNRSASIPHFSTVVNQSKRASSASPQFSYERLLTGNMTSTTTRLQAHRAAFSGMGMPDAPVTTAGKMSGKSHSNIPIVRVEAKEGKASSSTRNVIGQIRVGDRSDINSKVELPIGNSIIFSTVSASENPQHARPTKRHSGEAVPRDYRIPAPSTESVLVNPTDIYMQAVKTARANQRKSTVPPKPAESRTTDLATRATATARSQLVVQNNHVSSTNAITAHLNALRPAVCEANKVMQARSQFQQEQVAQFQAQRSAEIIATSGELFGLASRVCRYGGNNDTAQFLSSTFSLFSGFCTFILSGSPVGLLMPFISFFLSNRAAEAARRFAEMIEAASQSLDSRYYDVMNELHAFQILFQKELRYTGALVAELLAEQNACHRLKNLVFDELAILHNTMSKHFKHTNADLHVLMMRNLKTKYENLELYLNESDTRGVKPSLKGVREDLHDLEFWIMSRLHDGMMNGANYLNVTSEDAVSILSEQACPFISTPGFFASRVYLAVSENIPPDVLSLPPMSPYFSTIELFCTVLIKHPEFLSKNKGEAVFAHIQATLTTYGELISFLKTNEAKIRLSQLSLAEKEIILKPLANILVYETAIEEMKKGVSAYQKRLLFLTDHEQQLEAFTRQFFYRKTEVPESQGAFWKRNAETDHSISCVIACDEFCDDLAYRLKFIDELASRNIRAIKRTIDGENFLQVTLDTSLAPRIMPAHSPSFFKLAHPVLLTAAESTAPFTQP